MPVSVYPGALTLPYNRVYTDDQPHTHTAAGLFPQTPRPPRGQFKPRAGCEEHSSSVGDFLFRSM